MLDPSPLSSNPTKMVKHTQTIRRLLPTNSLSVFNHFVGLALKWIALSLFLRLTWFCYCYIRIFDVLANIIFSYCHQQHSHYYFFSLFRVGFFIGSLPYGSYFSPTWNLGSLLGLSQVPVFSHAPLLVLDYKWSHNPPTYQRTVTPNWYRTHIAPKFGLQSSSNHSQNI